MKETTAKLKKKELKTTLIEGIEKLLNINEDERKLKKVRKAIRDAANQISKRYLNKVNRKQEKTPGEKPTRESGRKNQLMRDKSKVKKKEPESPAL